MSKCFLSIFGFRATFLTVFLKSSSNIYWQRKQLFLQWLKSISPSKGRLARYMRTKMDYLWSWPLGLVKLHLNYSLNLYVYSHFKAIFLFYLLHCNPFNIFMFIQQSDSTDTFSIVNRTLRTYSFNCFINND